MPRNSPARSGFGGRLQSALRDVGLSQSDLSRALGDGTTPATISRWISGRFAPPGDQIERIEKLLGRSPGTLLVEERTHSVPTVDKDARSVPLAGAAAAGAPMARIIERADIQHFHFPEAFLRTLYGARPDSERAILLTVEGHSMEPDLPHHSLVFVDRGPRGEGFTREKVQPGEVYMVRPPGEDGVTLKRVSFADDWIHLEAIKPDRRSSSRPVARPLGLGPTG